MSHVTIIIATFNVGDTLQRCIDSILSQSYRNWTLIVIDGGSTDNTVDIIQKNTHIISHWESEPDNGIYHAWNKAIRHARGDWITFLGADDAFSDPGALTAMVEASDGSDLVFGRIALLDKDRRRRRVIGAPWEWKRLKCYQMLAHPGALHRRGLFDELGYFDERYRIAGDYDFLLRVGPGARTTFVDRVIVDFSDSGVSRKQIVRTLKETRSIQRAHPAIGPLRADWNYAVARIKAIVRSWL